jgi:hypothetical protein
MLWLSPCPSNTLRFLRADFQPEPDGLRPDYLGRSQPGHFHFLRPNLARESGLLELVGLDPL